MPRTATTTSSIATIQLKGKFDARSRAVSIASLPSRNAKSVGAQMGVEGIMNFLPFQGVLVCNRNGSCQLKVTEQMVKVLKLEDRDIVELELTRLGDESETRVPSDLRSMLLKNARAATVWNENTPLARRDWIFWLITARQEETRERRIEKARDMLSKGKKRVCCFGGVGWLMKSHMPAKKK